MNTQTVDFDHLNSLEGKSAVVAFLKCSGAQKWSDAMVSSRPFNGLQDLRDKSEAAWSKLNHQDWLEAFSSHPKIGDVNSLREKFASTAAWARGEQQSVSHAPEQVLHGLSDANKRYEEKFGHIFIVCATGKSAQQMLRMLEIRLQNEPGLEFAIACGEQKKITLLRLEKLTA